MNPDCQNSVCICVLAFCQQGLRAQDVHYASASDVAWFGMLISRLGLHSESQSFICKGLI